MLPTEIKDARLDRLVQFDNRSLEYRVRTVVRGLGKPRSYTWKVGTWLDQGQEGACVGFGFSHELAARPKVVPVTNEFARNVYFRAQKIDEWPGENYSGTSVLAGAKILTEDGYYSEYRWAMTLQEAVMAVGYKGPVVVGFNWHDGMMDTDSDGFIRPTGTLNGGHCTLIYGVQVAPAKRYFLGWNSWGQDWGVGGTFKMTFDDFESLMNASGDVLLPTRKKK